MNEIKRPLPEESDLKRLDEFRRHALEKEFLSDLQRKSEDPLYNTDILVYFDGLLTEYEEICSSTKLEHLNRTQQIRNTLTEAFGGRATEIRSAWRKTQSALNIDNS